MKWPRDTWEVGIVIASLAVLALAWGFMVLAGMVLHGDTHQFDEWMLGVLRRADDPAVSIGPAWLQLAAQDITALGSGFVLGFAVLVITGYLLLNGLYRNAAFIFAASVGGWMLQWILKAIFDRARPDVVPHLRAVMSSSFPSGHALTSAAVYLTLGVLLMRVARGRLAKYYCLAVAMLVTFLVGASRVLLGVHYPSDVLAGWIAGLSWALVCLMAGVLLERHAGLRQEQREQAR